MTIEHGPPSSGQAGEWCPTCGSRFVEGALFCEKCGRIRPSVMAAPPTGERDWRSWALRRPSSAQARPRKSTRSILKGIAAAMMLTAAVFFVVELVALTYGIKIVLPEIVSATYTGFVITPVLVPIFEITGHVLSAYYLFLVSAIIASATWMALSSARRFKAELTMTAPTRDHSGFFDIAGFFFATLFFDYALYFLMIMFGSEPTSPIEDEETWALLFGLANASVWEEIVSRTLLIGAPMVFVDMARRKLQIKKISYVVGGGFQLGIPEVSLVVFSSLMFGFAHFAGGWEAWKIVPTSLGGVMFGYLFLRYGLYASIMLHFGINYMLAPTEITGSESVLVGTGIMILIWMGIGAVMFFYYLTRIAEFVTGKRYFEPRPAYVSVYAPAYGHQTQVPQTAAPSAYQYQTMGQTPIPQEPRRGGFYVCPVCGGTEAKWISGKFQCLRCGNLS